VFKQRAFCQRALVVAKFLCRNGVELVLKLAAGKWLVGFIS
jgi:hypothetical protein